MKIALITPVPSQSRQGNRVTALRWARILRALGHRVTIAQAFNGTSCDVMIALHARRSFPSIKRFRELHPSRPLIVALTGTDLYGDIRTDCDAQQSLQIASRLVILQPKGLDELASHLHDKTRVIYQSMPSPKHPEPKPKKTFDVCVLGHLREVKDPFRAAKAARLLPASSRIRILHIGKALGDDMATCARLEQSANPRYRWLGELPRWRALRILARSHVLVLSSHMEGGANVISEALAAEVPILASHISSTIGLLGEDYPGYFPVTDTLALQQLLKRLESDSDFYNQLRTECATRSSLVHPSHEHLAWKRLIEECTT